MNIYKKRLLVQSISAAMVLTLAACGGGSDESPGPGPGPGPEPNPVPEPVTLSGQVARSGTLKNVVVCMDLNANDACDADEPASAPTGADGNYQLTYDPAKVTEAQVAASLLIAPVLTGDVADPATAIDSDFPTIPVTRKSYVLKRPAGPGGAINPLTTLVQAGVAGGMSEAAARENVALQLGIDAAKIDNYQDDPPQDVSLVQDSARVAASLVAVALRDGALLEVGDQRAAVAAVAGDLAGFNYFDAGNYYSRQFFVLDKPAGDVGSLSSDVRVLKGGGESMWPYNFAYLTAGGWRVCDDKLPITSTRGSPSRSMFCGALESLIFRAPATDLKDLAMADVVAEMRASAGNTLNVGNGSHSALMGALGAAKFPDGSHSARRTSFELTTPLIINNLNTDGRPQHVATTLPQLIDAYQASNANPPAGGNTLSLGILENSNRNLRVAFTSAAADNGTVQYYGCDLNDAQTVVSNCAAIATGTYTISTMNGVRVLQVAGHPDTVMDHTRGYAEVDWGGESGKWVYVYRQKKPAQNWRITQANRLNATAWAAMKSQLGL